MSFEAWVLFAVTEAVLSLTPGPAVMPAISASLTRGWPFGLRASVGILPANRFYFVLTGTGLGTILLASWELFVLIKWLGAAYLIWLGLRTFWPRRGDDAAETTVPSRPAKTFWHGVVTQAA